MGLLCPDFLWQKHASKSGVYLNLVEGRLWVPDVVSSNPTTPTHLRNSAAEIAQPK